MNIKLNCPTCKSSIVWNKKNPSKPFCSERCKLIDLGEWADESYTIASQTVHSFDYDPTIEATETSI